MAYTPETKITRAASVTAGAYKTDHVRLTIVMDNGESFEVEVHPDTASKFHCGAKLSIVINVA